MCGIRFLLGSEDVAIPDWLKRRGPDEWRSEVVADAVTLQASVLSMRPTLTSQPVSVGKDAYLAWNGEVYQRRRSSTSLLQDVSQHASDTELVAEAVTEILALHGDDDFVETVTKLASFFATLVNAEFAVCLVTASVVYYGRDVLGRRSLLEGLSGDRLQQVSSVVDAESSLEWKEVVPGHVHGYQFETGQSLSASFQTPRPPRLPLPKDPCDEVILERASLELERLLVLALEHRLVTGSEQQSAAILYSGGLDSAVLAALSLKVSPPTQELTLVTVSFVDEAGENGTKEPMANDVCTAMAGHAELLQLFPDQSIRFVHVQSDWTKVERAQEQVVQPLMAPKVTTMDLNISTALWFAAQGASQSPSQPRILISGLGADEQLGGYGRHRKAWQKGGDELLEQELALDMDRLWERNLGRDDRILADAGMEMRYPYLDHAVVDFLARQPVSTLVDYSLPPGQGDKRILRRVAARLGLTTASTAVKRAIQFGSRVAHVSDSHRFGSRRQASGVAPAE